jgi:transposase
MRGEDRGSGDALFSHVSLEARVPASHPLRLIRAVVEEALEVLSPRFEELYARTGRPSVAPEKLVRALLLQAFFSIRSERQVMQPLDDNLLFRWFVGLAMDAPVWDATTLAENRDRLLDAEVTRCLLAAVLAQPRVAALMSDEHFSVDGTLIQAWASHTSFRPKQAPAAPAATPSRTSAAVGRMRPTAPTRRMRAPPIPTRGSRASPTTPAPSWPMPGMCSWRTAAA